MWHHRAKHRREDGAAPAQSERCAPVSLFDADRINMRIKYRPRC